MRLRHHCSAVCAAAIGNVWWYGPGPRQYIAESGTGRDVAKNPNPNIPSRPYGLGRALESTPFAPKARRFPFEACVRFIYSAREGTARPRSTRRGLRFLSVDGEGEGGKRGPAVSFANFGIYYLCLWLRPRLAVDRSLMPRRAVDHRDLLCGVGHLSLARRCESSMLAKPYMIFAGLGCL